MLSLTIWSMVFVCARATAGSTACTAAEMLRSWWKDLQRCALRIPPRPGNLPEGDQHLGMFVALVRGVNGMVDSTICQAQAAPDLVTPGMSSSTRMRCRSGSWPLRYFLHKILVDHRHFNGAGSVLIGKSAA